MTVIELDAARAQRERTIIAELLAELEDALQHDWAGTVASLPKGSPTSTDCCPVARWLADRLPGWEVSVDTHSMAWKGPRDLFFDYELSMPKIISTFVQRFDKGDLPQLVA